jgi:hypothetical protein
MSITTFAEVKTAIADYLARSDLTAYIPDFIIGAETRIAYGSGAPFECDPLRIRAMETSADVTVTSGTGSLPTGFLQARRLYWSASPKRRLEQTSPEHFYGTWLGSTSASNPSHYVIEGDSIVLGPSVSGTVKLLYYKKFDPLATASPVPWLLTNAPHVYVYGALLEAAPFIRNDPRLQVWAGLYKSAVEGLNRADQMDRWSGSALAVKNDTGNP